MLARLILLAGVLSIVAAQSHATPVVWSGNGHSYEYVQVIGQTWDEADAAARLRTLPDGTPGYLATITGWSEQQFVQNTVLPSIGVNKNQVWIGGKQDSEAMVEGKPSAPSVGWQWIKVSVTAQPEAWNYTNWQSENEPSNYGSIDERYLSMWVNFLVAGQGNLERGTWNDEQLGAPASAQIIGMVVEWGPPSAPEPATAALSALGLALLALRRRRS